VLDGVKAGALGEHPAGEDALHLAGELHLVDLDKGRRIGRLGRWARVAHPRRNLERAELDCLVDGNFEMGNAPGDLVERGEDRDWVLNDLGIGDINRQTGGQRTDRYEQETRAHQPASAKTRPLHRTAHLLNGPLDDRSGALLRP
jgi:hypothetical protein